VDDHLIAALEDQDNGLQQPGVGVEAQAQLAIGRSTLVERFDPQRPLCGLDRILR
jgi:hypothetical protein